MNHLQTPKDVPEVPGFRIVRLIGEGGVGSVFLAIQKSLDRSVAIKVLNRLSPDQREETISRFRREAALMAKFAHPNVVGIIDQGIVGDQVYIVMDYLEGGNLRQRMQVDKPLPIGQARPILKSIANALSALHEQEIIHRDLKPENVLLDREGAVRIADFGIAASLDRMGEITKEEMCVGTPDYMAPEQRYRLPLDVRTDQFTFAFLAYELLTGRRPLGVPKPPSAHNSNLNRAVDAAILRGLSEDPDDRFPSNDEFYDALDNGLASSDRLASTNREQRRRVIFGLVATGLLIGAGGVAWSQAAREHSRQPPHPTRRVEQTGALPFRVVDGRVEVLLVRARSGTHWTIPKATQPKRMSPGKVAVGEAFEEAGVVADALPRPIGTYSYRRKARRYRVQVFPVVVSDEVTVWPEQFRARKWLSVDAAAETVTADGLRHLLQQPALEHHLAKTWQ